MRGMELIDYDIDLHPLIEDLDTGAIIFFFDAPTSHDTAELLAALTTLSSRYTIDREDVIVYLVDLCKSPEVADDFNLEQLPTFIILDTGEAHTVYSGYEECIEFAEELI